VCKDCFLHLTDTTRWEPGALLGTATPGILNSVVKWDCTEGLFPARKFGNETPHSYNPLHVRIRQIPASQPKAELDRTTRVVKV